MFATISVEENLSLSFRRLHGRSGVKADLARAYELFPQLGQRRNQLAGTLSGGEQRMLSLARVMVEVPKILIADELSLGLAPIIVDELYEGLRRLRDEGTALLIIEQQIGHALAAGRPGRVPRARLDLLARPARRGRRHRPDGLPADRLTASTAGWTERSRRLAGP